MSKLQIAKARIDFLVRDSSKFCSDATVRETKMRQIDQAIASARADAMLDSGQPFDLEDLWDSFKSRVLVALEMDRAVKEGREESEVLQNLLTQASDINSIWTRIKEGGLQGLIKESLETLHDAIEELERPKVQVPLPLPPPKTGIQVGEEVSAEFLQNNIRDRIKWMVEVMPDTTPRLARTIGSLAQHVADKTYGKTIKEAFEGLDPRVSSGVPLLKFLLLESCSEEFVDRFNTLEWHFSADFEEKKAQLQEFLKTIPAQDMPALLKDVFLKDNPTSESGKVLSPLLTDMIKNTSVSSYDERSYMEMLKEKMSVYDKYEEKFEQVEEAPLSFITAQCLTQTAKDLGSSSPRQFLKALDKALMCLLEAEEKTQEHISLAEKIDTHLYDALKNDKRGGLIENFSTEEFESLYAYLRDLLPDDENERITEPELMKSAALWLPSAIALNSAKDSAASNMRYVDEMIALAEAQEGKFEIPISLFYAVMSHDSKKALEMVGYLPLEDASACIKALQNYLKDSQENLNQHVGSYAVAYIYSLLDSYMKDPDPAYAERLKIEILHLLSYLGMATTRNVYEVLSHMIAFSEEASPEEKQDKLALAVMLIPEFVRLGEKERAKELAGMAMDLIMRHPNSTYCSSLREKLTGALLKASGFTFQSLDESTLGTLLPLQSNALDQEFIELFKQAIASYPSSREQIKKWIELSKNVKPFSEELSLAIAKRTLSGLGEFKRENKKGTFEEVMDRSLFTLNCLQSLLSLAGEEERSEVVNLINNERLSRIKLKEQKLPQLTADPQKVDAYIGLFSDHMEVGEINEALECARAALDLNSSSENPPKEPVEKLLKAAQSALKQVSAPEQVSAKEQIEALIFEICEKITNPKDQIIAYVGQLEDLGLSISTFDDKLNQLLRKIGDLNDRQFKLIILQKIILRLKDKLSEQGLVQTKTALSSVVESIVSKEPQQAKNNLKLKCQLLWKIAIGYGLLGGEERQVQYMNIVLDLIEGRPQDSRELHSMLPGMIVECRSCLKKTYSEMQNVPIGALQAFLRAKKLIVDPKQRLKELISFRFALGFENETSLGLVREALAAAWTQLVDPNIDKYLKREKLRDLLEEVRLVDPSKEPEVLSEMAENEFDLTLEGCFLREVTPELRMQWCIELAHKTSEKRVVKILNGIQSNEVLDRVDDPAQRNAFLDDLLRRVERFSGPKQTVLGWIHFWDSSSSDGPEDSLSSKKYKTDS